MPKTTAKKLIGSAVQGTGMPSRSGDIRKEVVKASAPSLSRMDDRPTAAVACVDRGEFVGVVVGLS